MSEGEGALIGFCIAVAFILVFRIFIAWKDAKRNKEQKRKLEAMLRAYHMKDGGHGV